MSSQEIPQTTTMFMTGRKFEITIISADNLPNVRRLGRMKVYAKVSLNGISETTKKTKVDRERKTNPRWNFHVEYPMTESTVQLPGVNLVVKLFCKRTLGDRFIGEVNIPVKSLFDMGLKAHNKILSYSMAGTPNGSTLNISYSFGEKILIQAQVPVPEPSGWKKALRFAVEGTVVLLTEDPFDWI